MKVELLPARKPMPPPFATVTVTQDELRIIAMVFAGMSGAAVAKLQTGRFGLSRNASVLGDLTSSVYEAAYGALFTADDDEDDE